MKSWDEVKAQLLRQVFVGEDSKEIEASKDLRKDGFLKSLSVIAIISVLHEANEKTDYLMLASAKDFTTLESIRGLYEKG